MATKRNFRLGVIAGSVLVLSLVTSTFASCSGGKGRRLLKTPGTPQLPVVNTQPSADTTPCQPLSNVFLSEVWAPVVAPTCVRCHGEGGVGSGSAFAVPLPSQALVQEPLTKLQVHDLMEAWRTVGTGDRLESLIGGVTGARYHGGGTLFAAGSPQVAALRRFNVAAQSTEDCVTFVQPDPDSTAPDSQAPDSPQPAAPSAQPLSAATLQACRSVFASFKTSAAAVISSNCVACHGPGAGQLTLGVPSSGGPDTTIFTALMGYALPGKTANLFEKPTATVPHGGGQILTLGGPEALALQELAATAASAANSTALGECVAKAKADPGAAASIWGP